MYFLRALTPEDIEQLFEHEHGLETFVEKTSGLPFMDRVVTGLDLGGVVHDA